MKTCIEWRVIYKSDPDSYEVHHKFRTLLKDGKPISNALAEDEYKHKSFTSAKEAMTYAVTEAKR